jgi:hypothetical protein
MAIDQQPKIDVFQIAHELPKDNYPLPLSAASETEFIPAPGSFFTRAVSSITDVIAASIGYRRSSLKLK